MKVTGFSFIRNAIKFDYPIVEAVRSILPLCDEVVIAVGQSEDETLELVRDIDPKVRIIETVW
ncbi:MAG: glycosyltransferase family 2 protein, partial [Bacteroidota bacterium]